MGSIINCECEKCSCNVEFEAIDGEELLNLIQHGRLTQEKSIYLKFYSRWKIQSKEEEL